MAEDNKEMDRIRHMVGVVITYRLSHGGCGYNIQDIIWWVWL